MKVGWVYHPRFLDHDTGRSHVECPGRLQAIIDALREAELLEQLCPLPFSAATPKQLSLVHDPAYVDILSTLCQEGFTFFGDKSTTICPVSFDVAALATGGVLAACDAVLDQVVHRAFCAVRPPGHHASADQALGFCLLNHVATAAEHLRRNRGLRRVAIVDLDVHHGNGTQQIFVERDDVLYVSVHERPESLPFPGSGHAHEVGLGAGRGSTLNVPLDRAAAWPAYRAALDYHVLPALEKFRPAFLLLSMGFDALAWDNIAQLSLQVEDFGRLTEPLVALADDLFGGRLVSVLEGGYDLGHLGPAVVAHVRALLAPPAN